VSELQDKFVQGKMSE